jgi:pimeloyl-ACP methyl ester carboxylesterase
VLAQWPLAHEERVVPTRVGPTHVVISGRADAPPLVLLPSFAGSATAWRLNVAGLGQHFRTFAVDVIGQPGKSLAERRLRDRRDYSEWMSDLLDGLSVARASIVGCSFGGFVALNQVLATPERVDRVVLISPAGVFASQYWKLTYAMRVRAPLARLFRRLRGAARPRSMADIVRRPPRDAAWAAQMATTMVERAEVSVISPTVFTGRQLRTIAAPTLLLIGAEETLYEPQVMLKLARRRMPGLTGDIVPEADHIAAMAQPDDVNARIIAFLNA